MTSPGSARARTGKQAKLEIRVAAGAIEHGVRTQISGRIRDITPGRAASERLRQRFTLPVGADEARTLRVQPGRYAIDAYTPLGRILDGEIEVVTGKTSRVVLSGAGSGADASSTSLWQDLAANPVEPASVAVAPIQAPRAGPWRTWMLLALALVVAVIAGLAVIWLTTARAPVDHPVSRAPASVEAGPPAEVAAAEAENVQQQLDGLAEGEALTPGELDRLRLDLENLTEMVSEMRRIDGPPGDPSQYDAAAATADAAATDAPAAADEIPAPPQDPAASVPDLPVPAAPDSPIAAPASPEPVTIMDQLGDIFSLNLVQTLLAGLVGLTGLTIAGLSSRGVYATHVEQRRIETRQSIAIATSAPLPPDILVVASLPAGPAEWDVAGLAISEPRVFMSGGAISVEAGDVAVVSQAQDAGSARLFSVRSGGVPEPGAPPRWAIVSVDGSAREIIRLPIPWRLRSGRGEAEIEIRTPAKGSAQRPDVAVKDPGYAAMLGYLSTGRLPDARAFVANAEAALFHKMTNPYLAAAGGYILLGTWKGEDAPWRVWLDNLHERTPWLPDAALLRALSMIQIGDERGRDALLQAFEHGVPVFTDGVRRLRDALLAMTDEDEDGRIAAALKVVRTVSARCNPQQVFTSIRIGRS